MCVLWSWVDFRVPCLWSFGHASGVSLSWGRGTRNEFRVSAREGHFNAFRHKVPGSAPHCCGLVGGRLRYDPPSPEEGRKSDVIDPGYFAAQLGPSLPVGGSLSTGVGRTPPV